MSGIGPVCVSTLPGWDAAYAEALERYSHCDYAWDLAGRCVLPISRKMASCELVRALAILLTEHETYRPRGLAVIPGGRAFLCKAPANEVTP